MKNRKFPCVWAYLCTVYTSTLFHPRTNNPGGYLVPVGTITYTIMSRGARRPRVGRRCRARVNGALLLQLQWPWHHPAQSGECRVCCADRIVDCALVIAGKIAGRTHSQRRRSPRSTVKLSLAIEGILERRVLALEILERLGSASRRLPLELENLQGAGCRMQGVGCRV